MATQGVAAVVEKARRAASRLRKASSADDSGQARREATVDTALKKGRVKRGKKPPLDRDRAAN